MRSPIRFRSIALALALLASTIPSATAGQRSKPLWRQLPGTTQSLLKQQGKLTDAKISLRRLQKSKLNQQGLIRLLKSEKAAPFLGTGLHRLAEIAHIPGTDAIVHRLMRGGQNGAYELAVAHAYRHRLRLASGFFQGNEVDGMLKSGTILEAKSGPPKDRFKVVKQARTRAAGGNSVTLLLNYQPQQDVMKALKNLGKSLDGRLRVIHLPMEGTNYKTLVPGTGDKSIFARSGSAAPPKPRLGLRHYWGQ